MTLDESFYFSGALAFSWNMRKAARRPLMCIKVFGKLGTALWQLDGIVNVAVDSWWISHSSQLFLKVAGLFLLLFVWFLHPL